MQFFSYTYLALPFAVVVNSAPTLETRNPSTNFAEKMQAGNWEDMILSNFCSNTYHNGSTGTTSDIHREFSFLWSDPNSNNTSAVCKLDWPSPSENTTAPIGDSASYRVCKDSENETFKFYFVSWESPKNFTLQLLHQYQVDDPAFPPPWNYPSFYSTPEVHLACTGVDGLQSCYLPADTPEVKAVINGSSD